MTFAQFIVVVVVLVIIFALLISGKLRALGKAFFNLFVEDLAATPEGADALYRQKEEETEEKFRNADNVYKKIAGQRVRCKNELDSLKEQLKRIEQQCERLAKANDEEGLDIKVQERQDILDDIANHQSSLQKLDAAHLAAKEAREACEEALNAVRKEHKQVVTQMRQDKDMSDIYKDLEGIGADTDTTKLLKRVREKSNDLNDIANGAREAYETRTSTKARKVDQRINKSAGDDYKQKLMEQYGKK